MNDGWLLFILFSINVITLMVYAKSLMSSRKNNDIDTSIINAVGVGCLFFNTLRLVIDILLIVVW